MDLPYYFCPRQFRVRLGRGLAGRLRTDTLVLHHRGVPLLCVAGEAGKKLESFHNTELAAMLIYRESSPHRVSAARFYDGDEEALADMKKMAELEASA